MPLEEWFSAPAWRQSLPGLATVPPGRWLAFTAEGPAAELTAALRLAGADVVEAVPGERCERDAPGRFRLRPDRPEDYEALLSDLAAEGGEPTRILHAWTLAGEPAGADPETTWAAQDLGFFSLLHLVQAIAGRERAHPVELDVVTAGAMHVAGRDLLRAEHATVAGVARVAPVEVPALTVRLVDLDPAGAVREAVAELLRAERDEATALRGGRRWVPAYEPVRVPPAPEAAGGLAAGLREGGAYLITGGLGGIGITLAEDLATRCRARLALVARSALPARESWDEWLGAHGDGGREGRAIAAIRRAEAAGGEVLVLAADVTSEADLRRVRQEVLGRFGRLDGIVHAAGLPGAGMAEVRERAAAERVLAPKLLGTLALRRVFGDLDLDFVALCSSLTAVAGGFGQVDYCAANAFLDAHASSAHGWRARVVSIDWAGWLDVGMAAEVAAPESFRALERGERDPRPERVDHPLLRGPISARTHWVLDEHRIAGTPVVPGTAHLEAIRAALAAARPAPAQGMAVELRDVVFVEPLAVPDGGEVDLRVTFADDGEFRLESVAVGAARMHVRGSAGWVSPGPAANADLAAIRARCVPAPQAAPAPTILRFGQRWDSLREVRTGAGEELARVEAPPAVAAELDQWVLHPALLDVATSFGTGRRGTRERLPFGYGRVLVRGPLPAAFWSHLRYQESGAGLLAADLSLLDDAGRELVAIGDFVLRDVDASAVTAVMDGRREARAGGRAGAGGGIPPADGAEAFRRLLAADLGPQVLVVPTPIGAALAGARRVTAEAVAGEAPASGPSPAPDAPAGDLEETLARIWAEVLSVEVGVDDNFFELGGNSLVAAQLISAARRAVGVALPMRTLFDAPTVAGMAARVRQLRAAAEPDAGRPPRPAIARLPRRGTEG
jgi:acyl carrier protein